MKRKCASLLLIPGLLSPGIAAALGLGEIKLDSYLNEPLQAEVRLLETDDLDPSQIRVRLATREDFTRAGVDRAYLLTSLRFEVIAGSDGSPLLLITSREPIREPYLDFIVEARWPNGRLLREYTLLLDPPVFTGEGGLSARASTSRGGATTSRPSTPAEPEPAPAPRPAPQRNYGSDALDRPVSGENYMVARSDTLWQIASVARPGDASIQQTMLDIQRLNPEAFIGGNINQLKAGYVLRLPTADQITPQSFEEAVAEVERQTQRWQDAAAGLDVRMDASEGLDMSGVSGSDRGEGHLQIAGVEEQDEGMSSGDISARMEDLDRSRRENRELSTRVDSMEEQLEMQERLISLKDEQIAALQDALAKAGSDVEMPAEIQEGTIEPLEAPSEPALEPEPAESVQPPPAPAPSPAPPPPAPTLLDMLMENIIYVGAGILALLLLVLFLLRNKLSMPSMGRKRSQDAPAAVAAGDEDDFADVSLSDDSLIVDEVDEDAAPEPAEVVSSFSAPDEQAYAAQFESGDALAEADIYIAYGRFPQAVDLLKAAISHEPVNTDYRIKLMEACVEMVESGEFQQQYADLQVIGDENVLARARSMLEAVDGGEVWLDDLPEPTITPEQVAEGASASAASSDSLDLDLTADDVEEVGLDADADGSDGLDLDLGDDSGDLDLELDSAAEEEVDSDDGGLEFDLDSGMEEAADDEDEGGLDIDFESPVEEEPAEEFVEELAEELAEEPAEEPLEEDFAELTLEAADDAEEELVDIELPDVEIDSLGEEPDAEDNLDEIVELAASDDDDLLSGLDELEIDLGEGGAADADLGASDLSLEDSDDDLLDLSSELDSEPAAAAGSAGEDSLLDMDSELDGVEFDLDDDSGGDLAGVELDMSGDDGEEGLVFAADGDEMATKLDLARAYIDMGDHDGARTILDEVVASGNEGQQQEARSLLEGID